MLRQYELVERVKAYDPDADEAMLNRAYVYTVQKHGTQKRASGDPYFSHPVEVAGLMTDLRLDQQTIATALLHDTVEDTLATIEDIEANFGPEIARLVDGVTKLSKIEQLPENERAAENLRKFLLAMSEDIRVLLVKLGDRLHNMRTLHFIKNEDKRRRIARETMDIYAPLAERVGMYEYMREMQALAFEQLEPEAYATITGRLAEIRSQDSGQVDAIALAIKQALAEAGLSVEVSGREKHPYSIWKKMAERHLPFDQVTDIFAFRVITESVEDCYRAMGVLHTVWQFIPGKFKDYISTPKSNGYRSLHTSLIYENSMRVEVQIRTQEMHRTNEFGLAAHWAYKQHDRPDGQVGWLRDLIEIVDASHDPDELLEHTRLAIYQDRIFAFTPKGALFQLPKGATPVDFAFAVHTDLGAQTVGAKINGRHMPLRTPLANGDVVEIIKGSEAEPQLSWLGFVVTGKARAAIRRAVRNKEREDVAELGSKLYDQIAARTPAKVGKKALREALKRLGMEEEEDLMYAIGAAQITDHEVMEALVPGSTADFEDDPDWGRHKKQALSIRGLKPGNAYTLAQCCHPVPGDRIVGLRRKGESVEVHNIQCLSLASGIDNDWLDLDWGNRSGLATGRLSVTLYDRRGTIAEMANIVARNNADVRSLDKVRIEDPFATYEIDIEVQDLAHLTRILSALRASDAVAQADRI
ncbi:bifunctional (p)ppGpp synthetase/guanosine-3',5'-bis(diphosphate) 3'-pyrophosphohydrolase [Citromicrobium bathyomarinum]|uniref:GTP pyrophosphokinase rsh n=1 Tax=Alteriqipengyuania abyssalis TaxID=2860200 RepID=A0ABS7PFT7_9SPHN|nr:MULTISPECIES: bifunctional (p)ppGpp synthetase/guanosine-3',5'-bis(diphosphate) 3'-pyrophosphohydrolase [Sphingomonadales]ALG60226.1 GTP pyrophosphokinase [Citromicrobium sp. JL477]KPM14315.1 GTP pyrophosphokinase [Citromicrobium sp. WPS32]KPM18895.1 GTP pyrophosphokinase [Citromicrobium sp. JL1351]KPM20647.1 GTP pyrophosphokinase [Citromicrobium sp. JL31]KPM22432.1 GTP pyrophosphokinase [Citromicrobium sp. RCC1885]|tara:strand:- start:6711 stop:8804 length:2094 start_codon:yes stop_codon:yes gene_type:complete